MDDIVLPLGLAIATTLVSYGVMTAAFALARLWLVRSRINHRPSSRT